MLLAPLRRRVLLGVAGTAVSVLVPLVSAVAVTDTAAAAPAPGSTVQTRTVTTADAASTSAARKKARKARKAARAKSRAKARRQVERRKAQRILKVAARYKGRPYRWGASGPSAFDCSGYTSYVVRRAIGKHLPHNSAAQSRSGKVDRVSRGNKRPGDLVFFYGGGVHHVAIYAGKGKIWHAPRPGKRVQKAKIYSSKIFFGRVV